MKTPEEIAVRLIRQWHNPKLRLERLLDSAQWPLQLAIGKPDAERFQNHPEQVLRFIESWRRVKVGRVEWRERKYRHADEPVSIPRYWRLDKPSEWVQACADPEIRHDYALLSRLIGEVDSLFHPLLVRQWTNIRALPQQEILKAADLSLQLEPGIAQGRPLRALSLAGIDSKFIERNRRLLVPMLDLRFAGEVSEIGLETFLGATSEDDHWLLVVSLQPGILPFERQRVRASELTRTPLPASWILLVENERCVYQLPQVPDCIAILGAGLNLNWMQAEWLSECRLAYWGDVDTWGLAMLARARSFQPHLQALMMDYAVFERYQASAVEEVVTYEGGAVSALRDPELQLFRILKAKNKGRLEQEFLPAELVQQTIARWVEEGVVGRQIGDPGANIVDQEMS
jgi:hypothetical protein